VGKQPEVIAVAVVAQLLQAGVAPGVAPGAAAVTAHGGAGLLSPA
jgi:xanthine/CO dehydrogenase XdhC/CoxF family maturation factor